ncbi:MAG: site-specific DNA recombinase [Parcubacteria bacterium C7867-008]|nr:MAG: site-specific DNA recombinase [Parcubacteria bacterium C7867-008]
MSMAKTSKPKYFAYLRKSSEDKEKQALSIPAQKAKLSEMFADLDIEFIEEERSAFIPYNRPKFADMLIRMRSGERNGLLAWHPDRLSRNEVDASAITYTLRTGEISDLKFATYHFENNSPEGIWMLQMALSQSQYESAKKGRDVKRGLEQKAKMGVYPAPAPLGYKNDKFEERGKKRIYTDTERLPLLRKMVDLMLTGDYTPPRILEIATNDWGLRAASGKKISRSNAYNLFTRPFYYGEFEYPVGSGLWYQGTHEPLMTREEFDRIQFLLGRRSNPRPKGKREITFRGPIRCGECNALITGEEKWKKLANGGVAHYTYYHCTKRKDPNCSQKAIEEQELQKQIVEELSKLEIPPEFTTWAVARLKDMNAKEITDREQMFGNQRREYDACLKKIDNLIDMRSNSEIDEHEFRSRKEVLLAEKDRLWSFLKDTDKRVENWLEIAERGFNFAEKAPIVFSKANTDKNLGVKKEIFSALGSDYKLTNGKLSISLDNLLFPIRNMAEEARAVSARLEPENQLGNTKDIGEIYSKNPSLLRD